MAWVPKIVMVLESPCTGEGTNVLCIDVGAAAAAPAGDVRDVVARRGPGCQSGVLGQARHDRDGLVGAAAGGHGDRRRVGVASIRGDVRPGRGDRVVVHLAG